MWTDKNVELLRKLWAEGKSSSQIAKAIGGNMTRNAVIGKVHRLGLSGRAKPSRPAAIRTTKPSAPRTRTAARAASPSTPSVPARVARAAPSKPPTPPVEAKPLPSGEYATIMTIRDHMCKWPIGDPATDDFWFCGLGVQSGKPYCEAHVGVAFQPMSSRRDRRR